MEDGNLQKKYKIGDVARILGISADLIRYYEEKGVVSPEKDPSNKYRYYDTWDINYLIDCLWFKNYGFSIENVAQMVSTFTYPTLLDALESKTDEIREEIHRKELLLQRIEKFRERLSTTRSLVGDFEITTNKPFYYYLNRHNAEYDHSTATREISRRWLKYMPFTRRYFEVDRDAMQTGGDDYAWGFSVSPQYVSEFGIDITPPVAQMPEMMCIHSAFKSAGMDRFSAKKLDFLLQYAEENGYTPVRSAFGNLACSVIEDGVQTGYFEVWLPIMGEARRSIFEEPKKVL